MKDITVGGSIKNNLSSQIGKTKPNEKSDGSFGNMLKQQIQDVNRLQQEAHNAVEGLASGEKKNIHETMIALEKADISFRLMMQVREKIVKAYEEIMRTPI